MFGAINLLTEIRILYCIITHQINTSVKHILQCKL